jgi:hypothetical protein
VAEVIDAGEEDDHFGREVVELAVGDAIEDVLSEIAGYPAIQDVELSEFGLATLPSRRRARIP